MKNSSRTGFRACVETCKNRFPHPFCIFIFVEAIQLARFYRKYKLWKTRLPHRLFSLSGFVRQANNQHDTLKSVWHNLDLSGPCSARLQAGTVGSSTCSPEGERYIDQNRIIQQTPKPVPLHSTKLEAEQGATILLAHENLGLHGGAR